MPVAHDLNGSIPASEAIRSIPANEKCYDCDDEGESWDRISMIWWIRKSDGYKFMTTTYPSDVNGERPLSVSAWAAEQSQINKKIEKVCNNYIKYVKSDDVGSIFEGSIGENEYYGIKYEIKKTNQEEIEFTLNSGGFSESKYTFNITHDDTDKQKLTYFLKRRIS